jgi:hypothetical protein
MSEIFAGSVLEAPGGANTRVTNYSVSAQAPVAATATYITGSQIAVPNGGLQVGTRFKWKFTAAKTAAGTATSSIKIVGGAHGTTADATMLTFTKSAGTAAADEGIFEVEAIVTAISSTAGAMTGEYRMTHNLTATGHSTLAADAVTDAATNIDTSNDVAFVGLVITTGAADALTIHYCTAEATGLSTGNPT